VRGLRRSAAGFAQICVLFTCSTNEGLTGQGCGGAGDRANRKDGDYSLGTEKILDVLCPCRFAVWVTVTVGVDCGPYVFATHIVPLEQLHSVWPAGHS
jgi:hypothetical protein